MRPIRALALLLLTMVLSPFASPLAAIDGELDTDDFYPPFGRVGFVGGGLVADGGLTAPDGMAIALMRDDGAEVRWRQVPPTMTPGTQCSITPQFATEARYHDGQFDSQGRLVLVGTATYPGLGDVLFAVRFLYPDCTADPEFDGDGYYVFDHAEDVRGLRVRTQIVHVLGLPVERLVVAGDLAVSGGGGDVLDTLVLRLRGDGTLDPTFDGDGWASYDFDGEAQLLADFVVDHERRIVFGANVEPLGPDPDFVVGRLLPDGELDTSLDTDGWWRLSFAVDAVDRLGAMELEADGGVLLAGTCFRDGEMSIGVHRLRGFVQGTRFATAGDLAAVTSAVWQGDGKLVVAGWSNGFDGDVDVFALRVVAPPDDVPAVDPTFGSGAAEDPLTYFSFEGVAGGTDAAYGLDLSGGKPVLFGEVNAGDPQGMFVARLENAYIFADGFENGSRNRW